MKHSNSRRIALFLLLILTLTLVHGRQILRGEPLLDDGHPLFSETLCGGFSSIFFPYAGSLLILERLILWLSMKISLLHAFRLSLATVLVVQAWILSRFVLSAYHWIVPSTFWRVVLVFFLALGPGTPEIHSVLAVFSYSFGTYVFFTSLEEKIDLRPRRVITLLLCLLSCSFSGIFFLVAAFRILLKTKGKMRQDLLFFALLCAGSLGFQTFLTLFQSYTITSLHAFNATQLVVNVFDRLSVYSVLIPFFGEWGTSYALRIKGALELSWMLPFACVLYLYHAARSSMEGEKEFFLALLGTAVTVVVFSAMHSLGRVYSLSPRYLTTVSAITRFYYIGYQTTLVILFALLTRRRVLSGRVGRFLLFFVIVQNVFLVLSIATTKLKDCSFHARRFLSELSDKLELKEESESVFSEEIVLPIGPFRAAEGADCSASTANRALSVLITNDRVTCSSKEVK